MRILMLGWEFAPLITGGLGRACGKIVDELLALGHSIDFVVPVAGETQPREGFQLIGIGATDSPANSSQLKLASFLDSATKENRAAVCLDSALWPYANHSTLTAGSNPYAGNLLGAVENYANQICERFATGQYDAIHAHDWLTFAAAQVLSKKLQIPFIAHFHSLESDRNYCAPNPIVIAIEKMAVDEADTVIAVSDFTRRCLENNYGLNAAKCRVIHNGTDTFRAFEIKNRKSFQKRSHAPTVLFMGRLTHQKGVQNFCAIAKEVLKTVADTKFVVAGEGDMALALRKEIAANGLEKSFSLVGLLEGAAVAEAYQQADVLMMPSISEPFGLVATEATEYGLPSVLSTACGAVEVLPSAFKAHPEDSVRFAQLITLLLANPEIGESVVRQSRADMAAHTWKRTARFISNSYTEAVGT